jgi:tetratricopeptide (TPR) repeat protein
LLPPQNQVSLFASAEKRNPVVCLLLAVVTLALYNPVNRHPFVNYDDDRYVTENLRVRQGLTAGTVLWALTADQQANWHPLTWMSHALDVSLFRLNPAGHHFTSVLLHALNAGLLFLLLIWSTEKIGPSLFVAALFAVHPINVESVAWVAERKNVLCTLFFFLTLWAYGWYARKRGWARYAAMTALFVAGLASKPMVITLPFVLLLLDYWPLARVRTVLSTSQSSLKWSRLALEKLPLLALSAASAFITVRAQQAGGAVRSRVEVSFGARLANALYAYAMYLWKMLWPARLAPMYPHPRDSLAAWQVLPAALVLLTISALVWKFRNHRYLLTGWLWFLGTLVPVIGLVQVGEAAMADRYAYIPLIGLFVMIAFCAAELAEHAQLGWWPAVPAAVVLAALAAVTHRQIDFWQSNYDLWTHTLAVTQNNFIAEDNLGGALILEGKEEEAQPHFAAAARINPKDPMSHSNLGTYFQTHHQLPEAVAQYEAAVQLTSEPALLASTYANLGTAYRVLDQDEHARESFKRSLQFNPNQFNAWLGLGILARKQGEVDEAITDFSRSVASQPTGQGYFELGQAYEKVGRFAEAREAYRRAESADGGFPKARDALDILLQPKQ